MPQAIDERAETLEITDPRDGSLVGALRAATPDEAARAVADARRAFPAWSRQDAAVRGAAVRRAAETLAAAEHELAGLTTRETGRPYEQALAGVRAGVGTLYQYAELGPVHRGRSLLGSHGAIDFASPRPRGVVVALTPWNDPVAIAAGLLGAAIATGNVVIHKPSERSPHVGERLGAVLSPVLPEGVLTTLTGGPALGALLTRRADVDVVAHIGSSATGRAIAEAAAATGAHVVRENGGNDALVVDRDVDVAWAASQAALGAFANSGQLCTAVERVYVHRAIAEPFLERLVAEAARLDAAHELGPLVDGRLRDEVQRQVDESVALGARVLVGGRIPPGAGSRYPATVVADCTDDMPLMREETFGPVAPVRVVEDFSRALELAAADRYGLAATVLTRSMANAQRAAAELPVGTVKVNAVFGGAPGGSAQPRGLSGSGYGYGPELLDELTTTTVVHLEPAP